MKRAIGICLGMAGVPLHTTIMAQTLGATSGILVLDDAGIYAATTARTVATPTTSSGTMEITHNDVLVQSTHDICAVLGTHFGFRYHLSGVLPAPSLRVMVRIAHPPLRAWHGGAQSVDTLETALYAGEPHLSGWIFRDPAKLVDGEWRFTILHDGRALLEQRFQIRTGCGSPVS